MVLQLQDGLAGKITSFIRRFSPTVLLSYYTPDLRNMIGPIYRRTDVSLGGCNTGLVAAAPGPLACSSRGAWPRNSLSIT